MNRTIMIAIFLVFTLAGLRPSEASERMELLSKTIISIPSLFSTYVQDPKGGEIWQKQGTSFPISIRFQGTIVTNGFLCNYHSLCLKDSSGNIIAETDTGSVLRNAKDTVIPIRVKVVLKNPDLDLVLLCPIGQLNFKELGIDPSAARFDLEEVIDPKLGENIVYCGFPKLIGIDPKGRKNTPLSVVGVVSQARPGSPNFIVQAPVFSGASGSPMWSQEDFRLVGVVFGMVPDQESFLYAINANEIRKWIKKAVADDILIQLIEKSETKSQ